MYVSGLKYMRSPEESRDVFLAWKRPDKAFFASGACHILAHMFLSLHYGEQYQLIYIKPKQKNYPGNHMYASDGKWAFDFNGWTLEEELLEVTKKEFGDKYKGWDYTRIVIKEGLPEYLKHSNHLRGPEYFPQLPWERAYKYVKRFSYTPPTHK